MNFTLGQRVRMKRTDNTGTVTRISAGDVIFVKLDSGLGHLPIPAEALELMEEPQPPPTPAPVPPAAKRQPKPRIERSGHSGAQPQSVSPRPTPPPPAPAPVPAPTGPEPAAPESEVANGEGIQLAFDPQLDNEANPVAYEVYLLNDTGHKIIYELKAMTGRFKRWAKSGLLEPTSKKRLDAVDYRWLNDKLVLELDVRPTLTGGTGPRHFEKVRIKPAQFFSKYQDVPRLYRDAHLYTVFPLLRTRSTATASIASGAPDKNVSLRALTRRHLENRPKSAPEKVTAGDLRTKIEFADVIDLHLDNLVDDPAAVAKHQKLQLQLKAYDEYVGEALRLGVDKVTIVHGVGDGVLKRAIHSRLHQTKFVKNFVNEYHPRYGFGATEIYFD